MAAGTSARLLASITELITTTTISSINNHINSNTNINNNDSVLSTIGNISSASRVHPRYVLDTIFVCDRILMPIICCLGILGNGLSLCVLTRREMAAATTCFLTALAVSDVMLLILQIPPFFEFNESIAATNRFQLFIRYYTVIK